MDEGRQSSGDVQRESDSTHSSYWSEIHVEMVALLVVVFLVLLAVGWTLRPSSSGYPNVPHGLQLDVSDTQSSGIAVAVALTRNADNGAVLTVIGYPVTSDPVEVTLSPPSGAHVCQPRHGDIVNPYSPGGPETSNIPYPRLEHVDTGETGQISLRSNRGLYFRFCWRSNAPVSLDGAYLSASLPTVMAAVHTQVQMVLVPHAGNTSSYSLQATPSPSDASTNSWTWSETELPSAVPTPEPQLVTFTPPIYLAAVNAGATQQDTLRAFFAGILLGIAGGALIAILQELISPLSRRRDARHPV